MLNQVVGIKSIGNRPVEIEVYPAGNPVRAHDSDVFLHLLFAVVVLLLFVPAQRVSQTETLWEIA